MWLEQSNKFAVPAKRASSNHEYCDQEVAQSISPSHAAIKISTNATAAELICKNIFPTPVQVKKIIKNKIGDIQQIYQNVL